MSIKKKFIKSKQTCKVTFQLPKDIAGDAKEVLLLGDFNEWDKSNAVPMKMNRNGFTATVDLPMAGEFQFRYLIDGEIWENDGEADKYVASPFGVENSVVSTWL